MITRNLLCLAAALLPILANAQSTESWQSCAAVADGAQRLACFDRWAQSQGPAPQTAAPTPAAAITEPSRPAPTESRRGLRLTTAEGCHDTKYGEVSRFWELEAGADCGTFGIRGYRPISLGLVTASTINTQPTSGNEANNAVSDIGYRKTETRLQLSVRTKIAQGLLANSPEQLDSLWFAYSQQSYWQLFTPALSRPFRSTDHEPELIYVRPLQSASAGEWRLRFGGAGLVHQSNGQSLPLSRSWNRVYLMAGAERDDLQLNARIWKRLHEGSADDDNPRISDMIGRAEIVARWHANRSNLLTLTARHPLRNTSGGSLRLEWFRALADASAGPSGLQLHTQLFSGYGDTLLDYNRRRTVFSIGLALVEW
ncbi:MAG: Phospholipase [Ramlibacter sp.]|nr:Phospholipase [Ramlibacter sp.]